MKNFNKNQKGFALLHILPAFILVAAIAFVGGSVYQAQQRKQDAARQATAEADAKKQAELKVSQQAEAETEEKTVDVPAPMPEEKPVYPTPQKTPTKTTTKTTTTKPKSEPTYTTVAMSNPNAAVGSDSVVLSAKMPGSYSGTCKALVKLPDGSNQMWFEAPFGPSDSCSVTVPKNKLGAGSSWKFYMYFKSADGMTKGEGANSTFNL